MAEAQGRRAVGVPAESPVAARSSNSESLGSFAIFIAAACVVGVSTGALAMAFKGALEWVARQRDVVVGWADHSSWVGWILVVALGAAMAGSAVWLVRRVEPTAEGSGIPRVESVVAKQGAMGHMRLVPVKFAGGVLSIGSGLALGR